jgi:molecular chaperone GrpE
MNAERLKSDRAALVALCLYAYDRSRSAAVAERIEQGLGEVGVTAVRPDGERFDPRLHEAGGTEPTDDAELDGTIAETEVTGFVDGLADPPAVLRVPVVTVYRSRAKEAG